MSDNRTGRIWKLLTDSEVELIKEAIVILTKLAIETNDKNHYVTFAVLAGIEEIGRNNKGNAINDQVAFAKNVLEELGKSSCSKVV